jgi:hypothetical protein
MTDNNARGTLINQVGAVFVPVADQDRALGFYLDTLGFRSSIYLSLPFGQVSSVGGAQESTAEPH